MLAIDPAHWAARHVRFGLEAISEKCGIAIVLPQAGQWAASIVAPANAATARLPGRGLFPSMRNPRKISPGLSRLLDPGPPDFTDLFRQPLVESIGLGHPLAVLVSHFSWVQLKAALVPYFAPQVWAVAKEALFG